MQYSTSFFLLLIIVISAKSDPKKAEIKEKWLFNWGNNGGFNQNGQRSNGFGQNGQENNDQGQTLNNGGHNGFGPGIYGQNGFGEDWTNQGFGSVNPKTNLPLLKPNQPCKHPDSCPYSYTCTNGICSLKQGAQRDGQCYRDGTCSPGYQCQNEQCLMNNQQFVGMCSPDFRCANGYLCSRATFYCYKN